MNSSGHLVFLSSCQKSTDPFGIDSTLTIIYAKTKYTSHSRGRIAGPRGSFFLAQFTGTGNCHTDPHGIVASLSFDRITSKVGSV